LSLDNNITHVGAFSESGKAHAAVFDWIRENNYKISGPPIEKYQTDERAVFNPSSFKIEVCYPVEPLV
jgi:effector-binding domain-containing protein